MKKIIITFLLALVAVMGYAQDPYQTKQTVSNPNTYGLAKGALQVTGPMWSLMTDTIHAYAIPKYRGAAVMRHADGLWYTNTGSYWRCVEQPFPVDYPLYVDYSDPAYPRGILKFAAADLFNNKLLRTGGITLNSGVVTVAPDIVWTFANQVKIQDVPSNFNIDNATDLRVDIIYIDSLDNMLLAQGDEDAIKALEPEIPYNAIRVARVDIDGTTISVTPTPTYEPKGILYANATGVPKTYAADFAYDDVASVLSVGNNRAPGTTSELYLNGGRGKFQGRFNGLRISVGSGFFGTIDLSKFITFENKGTEYARMGSTTLNRHYFKLNTGTVLKLATVDSLPGDAPHVLAMSGDSVVKYKLPAGGASLPYTTYVALLNQNGTSAPTATVLQNNTGLTITWSRISNGLYKGTVSTPFADQDHQAVFVGSTNSGAGNQVKSAISDFSGQNHVLLETFIAGTGYTDDLLLNTAIEIKIYP